MIVQLHPCAVLTCPNEGKPQVCPYDGSFHHHGRIHYDCHRAKHFAGLRTSLEFQPTGWFLMCDAHYSQIREEIALAERARVSSL